MDNPALTSVRAKLDRAEHHLDQINAALKIVLGAKPHADLPAVLERDFDRKHFVFKHRKPAPIDPALPLMIGDCIHNLRSALDHLVYQLALKNGSATAGADKTFFPIYLAKAAFDKRVEKLVKPFISAIALAEIEKCQPYTAYDVPAEADIWVLSQLDILDKHRLLVVAGQQFAATGFTITLPDGKIAKEIIANPQWKAMKDGAEILRLDMSQMTNPPDKMRVKIDIATTVQFVETGLACDGAIVPEALAQCVGIVGAIIRDFGKDFFGE